MKFYYGYGENNYIEITQQVLSNCLKNNCINIPANEADRVNIIGFDPYPGMVKHIIVVDYFNNKYIYTTTKEININFNSISEQLYNDITPKKWWEETGKFIEDPVERLDKLHKHINLFYTFYYGEYGGFEHEYPEQLMVMRNLEETSRVLEIGGGIGRVSHIIQTILKESKNHVIMEIDHDIANKLRFNLNLNGYNNAHVETNCLSKTRLYVCGSEGPRPIEYFKNTDKLIEVQIISYSELCKKYDNDFDTLVADCEGSLYYIFNEDPDMLNNIKTVIMENDYNDINHKQKVDDILKMKGFKLCYQEKGVPLAKWSCCYEYFYEVWKK